MTPDFWTPIRAEHAERFCEEPRRGGDQNALSPLLSSLLLGRPFLFWMAWPFFFRGGGKLVGRICEILDVPTELMILWG